MTKNKDRLNRIGRISVSCLIPFLTSLKCLTQHKLMYVKKQYMEVVGQVLLSSHSTP